MSQKILRVGLSLVDAFFLVACKKKATAIFDVALTQSPGDRNYVQGGLVKRGEYVTILEEKDINGKKFLHVQIQDVSTNGWVEDKWVKEGKLEEVIVVSDSDLFQRPNENSPKYSIQARAGQSAFQISKSGDFVEIQFPALGVGTAFIKKGNLGTSADIKRAIVISGLGKATVSASSQYKRTEGTETEFDPRNMFDGSLQSAWCEGASGDGTGESISVNFETPVTLTKIEVVNGWTKDESTYNINGRVKKIKVASGSGPAALELQDNNYDYQSTELYVSGTSFTFTIDDVYKGRDPDTCIAEIRLTGTQGATAP